MTDTEQATEETIEKLSARFNGIVRRAQAAILWERVWPKLVPPLCTSGLFLTASWGGLWQTLPPEGRMAGALMAATAFLVSPFLVKSGSLLVTEEDALKRIDQNTGSTARPAQTLRDKLNENNPPETKALWDLHLTSLWNKWAGKFEAGAPHPNMAARDPYKIRFAILFSTLLSAGIANGNHLERVEQAFDWKTPTTSAVAKKSLAIKAWVTPPDNIDAAPLYLTEDTRDHLQGGEKLIAHKTSVLNILTFGKQSKVFINGTEVSAKKTIKNQNKASHQYELPLVEKETLVTIENGPQWHFEVTPDNAPTVDIKSINKQKNNPGGLNITYQAQDDFGVTDGELKIKPTIKQNPGATPLPSVKIPALPIH